VRTACQTCALCAVFVIIGHEVEGGEKMVDPVPTPIRYTAAQACDVAGISRKGLYYAINSGDLPAVKCYGRFWILASDLEAWRERLPQINAFHQPICRMGVTDGVSSEEYVHLGPGLGYRRKKL
jgi:Helix-turn-helix domain